MSLIIARLSAPYLRIVADTKISDDQAVGAGPKVLLKSVIIDKQLVVCFAGNVGIGQCAIEDIFRLRESGGFYPVNADTSKKADDRQKGVLCPSEESSATSSSVRR